MVLVDGRSPRNLMLNSFSGINLFAFSRSNNMRCPALLPTRKTKISGLTPPEHYEARLRLHGFLGELQKWQ